MAYTDHIPADILGLYETHDYKHAAAILAHEFPTEFAEVCQALRTFRFTEHDVRTPGGNEGPIPKKLSKILRPMGWIESQLNAKLVIDDDVVVSHDTHKIDYLKGRVAFDLEWNSKDQTYDRDLYAFRAFFDYDKISVGVLLTRGSEMAAYFKSLGKEVNGKFGASTTHMGKLLGRLAAGRNGGCPVLVFGITPRLLAAPVP